MTLIRPHWDLQQHHHPRHRCSVIAPHEDARTYQKVWIKRATRPSMEPLVALEDREPYYDYMITSSSCDYVYVDRSYDAVGDELDGAYQLVRFDLRQDPPQEELVCEDLLHLVPGVWRTIIHGIVDVVDDRELYLVVLFDQNIENASPTLYLCRWCIESGDFEVLEPRRLALSEDAIDQALVAPEDMPRLVCMDQLEGHSALAYTFHVPTRCDVSQVDLGDRAALFIHRISDEFFLSLGRFDDTLVSYESFCVDQSCEAMYALALHDERIELVSFELHDRANPERVLHPDLRQLRLDGEPVGVRRLLGARDDRELYLEAWLDPEHTKLAWLKLTLSSWTLSLHTLAKEGS